MRMNLDEEETFQTISTKPYLIIHNYVSRTSTNALSGLKVVFNHLHVEFLGPRKSSAYNKLNKLGPFIGPYYKPTVIGRHIDTSTFIFYHGPFA